MKQERAPKNGVQVPLEAERSRANDRENLHVVEFSGVTAALLGQEDVSRTLGHRMFQMYRDGKRRGVLDLMETLARLSTDRNPYLREKSVAILSTFAGLLAGGNDLEMMVAVFKPLVAWFKQEDQDIDGFGVACSQMHRITGRLLEDKKYWPDTEQLMVVLHNVQEGFSEKGGASRAMAAKLLDSLADRATLDRLASTCLSEKSALGKSAQTIVTNLGRRSVVYLVNRLMQSESKEERLQLIKLIAGTGNTAVPVLVECLKRKPPWYIIRNIVFILTEIKHSSLYDIVRPYLSHRDIRVQQQALSCIVTISGNELKTRLIDALPRVRDELKMQIIVQLGQMGGEDVVNALLNLLASRDSFRKDTYIELLVKLCIAFKFTSTKAVIAALKNLVDERQINAGPTDPVIVTARDTLHSIQPRYRYKGRPAMAAERVIDAGFSFYDNECALEAVKKVEQSVKALVAQGDLEKAGHKLFANAAAAARDKDFASAELLRDKLLEINPVALAEMIRLGEIIEQEKTSSITNHHIAVWSDLYEKMTTREYNALYYAMTQRSYAPDQPVVRAGACDSSLYFINSGIVALSCRCGRKETFLKRLQQGDVMGVAQFFSASVWTVSMRAQTEAQIHVLTREAFGEVEIDYPELKTKLREFCMVRDDISEFLKKSGKSRRELPRYGVALRVRNMLLDPYGNAGKRSFRGELVDISRGGLCFAASITNRKNARLLLGRRIVSEILLAAGGTLTCFGDIVGVRPRVEQAHDFTIHVHFYRSIEEKDIAQAVNPEIHKFSEPRGAKLAEL